jgi:hypothetical protein
VSLTNEVVPNIIEILEGKSANDSITIDNLVDEYVSKFGPVDGNLRGQCTNFRRAMIMTGQMNYVGQDNRISMTERFVFLLKNLTNIEKISLIRCGHRLMKELPKRESATYDGELNNLLSKGNVPLSAFHEGIKSYVEETRPSKPPKQKIAAKKDSKQKKKLGYGLQYSDFSESIQQAAKEKVLESLPQDKAIQLCSQLMKENLSC